MIPRPKELDTERNQNVLAYLSGASAHGDVAEALLEACPPLGGFHHPSPPAPTGGKYSVEPTRLFDGKAAKYPILRLKAGASKSDLLSGLPANASS